MVGVSPIAAANPSQVPNPSPLRYPGGKTWLIPHARIWLRMVKPWMLVEPFAGGASVTLTAIMERLVERGILIELDNEVANFWWGVLYRGEQLAAEVRRMTSPEALLHIREWPAPQYDLVGKALRLLVLNRTNRGGVLAEGAAAMNKGEKGKGIASRWYPDTLADRIMEISFHSPFIKLRHGDAIGDGLLTKLLDWYGDRGAVFLDPPYPDTGERLYDHHEVDIGELFIFLGGRPNTHFLMTLPCTDDVLAYVKDFHFHAVRVPVKTGHHLMKDELVVTRHPLF